MLLRSLKDSLPLLIPTLAILIAGLVMWDWNASPRPHGAITEQDYAPAISAEEASDVPTDEIVARQDTGTEQFNIIAPLNADTDPPDATGETQPADAERYASLNTADTLDTSIFASAQLEDTRAQCVEDLRALAEQTRVYFPSGGVTADDRGIEGGRVLGLVAQDCREVQILVEGHSDPSGDPKANLKLSQARAEQVITRIAAAGIDTSMFVAIGKGDTVPSTLTGDKPRSYYDRRVEFTVFDAGQVAREAPADPTLALPWQEAQCVKDLQDAVSSSMLFYTNRSVSVRPDEFDIAMRLGTMAMECPQARLRVIGHHSGEVQAGETLRTGLLRAKVLMTMLVGRGIDSEQVIIAAPSRPGESVDRSGLPGNRVVFDVILEDG